MQRFLKFADQGTLCIYGFFFFLAALQAMWDLCSPTKDQTLPPAVEAQNQPLAFQESPQGILFEGEFVGLVP